MHSDVTMLVALGKNSSKRGGGGGGWGKQLNLMFCDVFQLLNTV